MRERLSRGVGCCLVVVALGACQGGAPAPPSPGARPDPAPAAQASAPVADPSLPMAPREFTPSLGHARAGEQLNADLLVEIQVCGQADCHPTVSSQWRDSMHRWSSFHNPFYRGVVEQFAVDNGREASRFCGGCHDPALQYSGAMLEEVKPDDRKAHAGITCTTCHGVAEATIQGNTSVALTTAPIPLPQPGDMDSLRAHIKRVGQTALRTDALCASCHIGFMNQASGHPVVVNGVNDFGPWRSSSYAGSSASRIDEGVEEQRCVDCHMPLVQGERKTVRSHRFPGGHTTMAAAIKSPEQMEALETLMKRAARVDVLPVGAGPGRPVAAPEAVAPVAGEPVTLDVIVINEGTGHRFPGGAQDLRDTWVEVEVRDAQGVVLAKAGDMDAVAGDVHEHTHRLRLEMVDVKGEAVEHHQAARFRSKAWDTLVPPRGARVVRFSWTPEATPKASQLPLQVEARVMHRRLPEGFVKARCEESRTPRGKAFLDTTQRLHGVRPDPCVKQPVVQLASWVTPLGAGAQLADAQPWWRRLYYRGLGLEEVLQEQLAEPQVALEGALAALGEGGAPRDRARVILELGRVRGRQGRTDEAEALFKQAEALVGPHAAVAVARGEANARVWRWKEAAAAWRQATELAPNDEQTWRGLAQALGSLSDPSGAYEAARQGLALEPRDPFLLRSQMLALRKLGPDDPRYEAAHKAFVDYERDAQANAIQSTCADQSQDCWLERLPIHEHKLVKPK